MKSSHLLLPALATGVHSFPAFLSNPIPGTATKFPFGGVFHELHNSKRSLPDATASNFKLPGLGAAFHELHSKRLLLDPMTTPIDVTGDHAFTPPDFEAGDQRGPCPALNALANHGYIPHDGVVSLLDVAAAINTVFGMGPDIALILAVMGTVFVGNPVSLNPGFSIGYASSESQNILGNVLGLLGTPRGLNGSHNIIEGDSSMTRRDLYVTGDATTLDMELFEKLYGMVEEQDGNYTYEVFGKRASERWHESVAENPEFYFGPFTGGIARNAGYLFACRTFANHSAENPGGYLNKATLKSFFGIQGEDGNLTYNRGWERIPDNWYRMPVDYTMVQFNLDLVGWNLMYPELLNIGGNTGTVNSFTGVDLSNLTGGVLNAATLLEGNNLLCFAFEIVKTVAPNSLSTLFTLIEEPLKLVTDALDAAVLSTACPAFEDMKVGGTSFEDAMKATYPGAARSGNVL